MTDIEALNLMAGIAAIAAVVIIMLVPYISMKRQRAWE